jgi:hypothetical protein
MIGSQQARGHFRARPHSARLISPDGVERSTLKFVADALRHA